MTYRVSATTCDDVNLDHELRSMAARGRARLNHTAERTARAQALAREKAARKKARADKKTRRREAAKARARAVRSCHRLGFVASPTFWHCWLGFSAWLLPAGLIALLVRLTLEPGWPAYPAIGAAVLLAPLTLLLVVKLRGEVVLRREQAWAGSLPFGLDNHLRALTKESDDKLQVRIAFRRAAPDRALVRNLLAGAGLLARADVGEAVEPSDPRSLIFRLPASAERGLIDHDNHGYLRWIRALTALLARMHRLHPVERVQVGA